MCWGVGGGEGNAGKCWRKVWKSDLGWGVWESVGGDVRKGVGVWGR